MTDRDFWLAIRAALLAFVDAIDKRWGFGKYTEKVKNTTCN
jgi:hypothetical protein